jgi:hypothetical protein
MTAFDENGEPVEVSQFEFPAEQLSDSLQPDREAQIRAVEFAVTNATHVVQTAHEKLTRRGEHI